MRLILSLYLLIFITPFFGQQKRAVDFLRIEAEITPTSEKMLTGIASYDIKINSYTDTIAIDAIDMDFSEIYLDGRAVKEQLDYDGKKLKIGLNLNPGRYRLKLGFTAKPKQTLYFMGWDDAVEGNEQIWTQGQGKYTGHWLPSFDDMNEKVEFDLTIHAPPKYTVIANGKLKSNEPLGNLRSWKFDMTQPMSSYLAAFAMGNFDKKTILSTSGIPIELYFEPKDSLKVEPTYRHTKALFDFLEQEIGVGYPWQNYKQVPVQDFLYAGMENTGCTIFSNTYMIDSIAFVDKNYVNVNAHELAHQWFGNYVTEQSGKHHWLHEGFATYYAYLAEKSLFGDEYFYWKLFETAKTLGNLSQNGDGEALTNPNANSLTFYEKGAWALVLLKDRVGEQQFRKGVKNYLKKYAYTNVTISDFLTEMEQATRQNLTGFRQTWLEREEFPMEDVMAFLAKNSPSLKLVYELAAEIKQTSSEAVDLKNYWNNVDSSLNFKRYLIQKHLANLPEEFVQFVLDSDELQLRQAFVMAEKDPKLYPKEKFESLLLDESYVTLENALLKLWAAYPEERAKYLKRTEGISGFPNKNIKLLWMTLALITPEFAPEKKDDIYIELNSYTDSENHFEVRQLAFQYLNEIGALNDNSLLNLIDASTHHVWQFKKSTRNLLRKFVKVSENKQRLMVLKQSMSAEQKERLNNVLSP